MRMKIYFIAAECSIRKSDYYCHKLKFYFAGLLKVYCVWKERELFCFWSRKELFHSKLTRKVLMFLLIFLGSTRWFQMFVIEMPLSIHCIFSKTFPFVAFFNLHFVVTKLRNSTLELHPLYKSSLWNLKWLVWLLITLFLYYYFFWENRRLVIRSCRSRGKLCRGLRWRYQ